MTSSPSSFKGMTAMTPGISIIKSRPAIFEQSTLMCTYTIKA